MFVSDILAQKGGLVFSVTPGTSVAQLSQQLSTRRIGSMLVLDVEGAVAGIVSERDLVRAFASHGAKAMELEARQVMTRDVVTCDPDDFDRPGHADHDQRPLPPPAGRAARRAPGPGVDRRRGESPAGRDQARDRGAQGLHRRRLRGRRLNSRPISARVAERRARPWFRRSHVTTSARQGRARFGRRQEYRPRDRARAGARRRFHRRERPCRQGRRRGRRARDRGGRRQGHAGDGRRGRSCRAAAARRRSGRPVRRRRHPGEQRGPQAPDLVPRHVLRGMARDHVGGARRRLPAGQGDHPADGGAGRRRLRGAVRASRPMSARPTAATSRPPSRASKG